MTLSPLRLGYLLAALIVVIWTGFIMVSRLAGTGTLTPFDVVAIRLGTAAILVLPFWLRGHRRVDGRVGLLALIGGLGYTVLVFSGFRLAPAAHGGILMTGSQPLMMALCAWVILGERPPSRRLAGIAVIILGAAVLGWASFAVHASTWRGDVMFLGASLCWSTYTVLARRWRISPIQLTINVVVLAAALYLPVYLLVLPKHIAVARPGEIVLQMVYQGVLAAVIQMIIYMKAVELLGPTRMGLLVAIVPSLAAVVAVPVLGEPLTPAVIASMALVSIGVLWGNTAKVPAPAATPAVAVEPGWEPEGEPT